MPAAPLIVPPSYASLRRAVEVAMVRGQAAVEQAKVRTYHETGRLIHEHVLLFQDRADYGAKTIPRLAADLRLDRSVLLRCVQFYRAFPIVAARRQLTWGHYRLLLPIADARRRRALAGEANRRHWTVAELDRHLQAERRAALPAATEDTAPQLLTPRRGTPGVCQVIDAGGGPVVDLGFACYLDLAADERFSAGELVRLDAVGRANAAPEATPADRFTYTATVLKVVDGDTLWVKVRLWSRQWVKQKLRLRDLDCPEVDTTAGQAAKRRVAALLGGATGVTIATTKPDKYDRYLADVFVARADGPEIFLNNALLAEGHAVRKTAWSLQDWEE